jgi:FdhD protein
MNHKPQNKIEQGSERLPFESGLSLNRILKWQTGKFQKVEDYLVMEEPLEIVFRFQEDGKTTLKPISVTMRTTGQDDDLILGFLFNEGLINSPNEILDLEFKFTCHGEAMENQTAVVSVSKQTAERAKNLDRHFYTNSSCGVCGKTSIDLSLDSLAYIPKSLARAIDPNMIIQLPGTMRAKQNLFHKSGGVHACGLFNLEGDLLHFCEDVGRHNAMDKLVGWCLRNDLNPASEHILMLSGRASFELIQKAMSIGIPVVLSVGAPSHLAVNMANESGMSLAGFMKQDSFNIYSGEDRFQLDPLVS